jgi:hypothetical protein
LPTVSSSSLPLTPSSIATESSAAFSNPSYNTSFIPTPSNSMTQTSCSGASFSPSPISSTSSSLALQFFRKPHTPSPNTTVSPASTKSTTRSNDSEIDFNTCPYADSVSDYSLPKPISPIRSPSIKSENESDLNNTMREMAPLHDSNPPEDPESENDQQHQQEQEDEDGLYTPLRRSTRPKTPRSKKHADTLYVP